MRILFGEREASSEGLTKLAAISQATGNRTEQNRTEQKIRVVHDTRIGTGNNTADRVLEAAEAAAISFQQAKGKRNVKIYQIYRIQNTEYDIYI